MPIAIEEPQVQPPPRAEWRKRRDERGRWSSNGTEIGYGPPVRPTTHRHTAVGPQGPSARVLPPARRRAEALPPNGWDGPVRWRASPRDRASRAAADVRSAASEFIRGRNALRRVRVAENPDRADECEAERR
ncbi:hypothetical protein GCM10010385_60770 [Streptomyces geysiriensis]|nr:hypothetical protein GCM10010385_60770 [Streptomyces geysiriensis]